MTRPFFNPRLRSLPRASTLVLGGVAAATLLSGFPRMQTNPWLIVPVMLVLAGTADTVRCMQPRWGWYHGGVILCLYMDLMAIFLVLFFLLYPYFMPFTAFRR